ncbi:MAG: c-type cytochrome [Pseudomonadota bacterium]
MAVWFFCACVALFARTPPLAAQQPDWRQARSLAAQYCQGCHGMDGLAKQANAPHIAGQPLDYLVR